MPNEKDVVDAASVRPDLRTDEQKDLIKSDKDNPKVKEALFQADREQRIYGTKDHK
jgi:hypothetical protein